eukprot:m51a1_g9021 hypothetical protein (347) ;mRNA; f:182611-184002
MATRLRMEYLCLLKEGNDHPEAFSENIARLRHLILSRGLPPQTPEELRCVDYRCSLRGLVWKIFLGVKTVDAERYTKLVARGPSAQAEKIDFDVSRTFQHDDVYHDTVHDAKLTRVLNAFVHTCNVDSAAREDPGAPGGYLQGVNVVAGALLLVLPEVDAFEALLAITKVLAPTYFRSDLKGVHTGVDLLRVVIQTVDPELFAHLKKHRFMPQTLMHPVLSLCTATPPLAEVLRLWDFLLAFGLHSSVVCAAAQVVIIRDKLFGSPCPGNLFRQLPDLDSARVIKLACYFVQRLPDDVWGLVVRHTWDPAVEIPPHLAYDPTGKGKVGLLVNLSPVLKKPASPTTK